MSYWYNTVLKQCITVRMEVYFGMRIRKIYAPKIKDNNRPILTTDLNTNIRLIRNIFKDDETLITRYIENQTDTTIKCCIFYIDGMVNNKLLNEDIIQPLLEHEFDPKASDLINVIAKQVTLSGSVDKTSDFYQIIQAIVYGDSVLLVNGYSDALIFNTKGWATRAIAEPEAERVLRGPREGFNESIMANLTMIRRKLRTQDLKIKFKVFGARTQTKGCICYIEGVANKDILAELERRLDKFSIDGTLDVNYISEFIDEEPYSPIKTIGSTERPDTVAGKLLEGRIALFLDGTPVVLTLPHLFIEHFQSSDDYYLNYFFASIGRLLRIFGFLLTISAPAVYVAITCFHHEMLPTPLMMSIIMARQSVPMPTVVEMFLMLIMFEILRETGNRMPSNIGQSLSIVGALVVGQAAVDAKLVSAPVIVIVATAGITGLLIPRIKGGIIIIRFILLSLSSILGLYGYIFGMMGLMIYLFNIRSFGIPIMNGLQSKQDMYIRSPWWNMMKRPQFMAADKTRSNSDGDPE